jgi:cytochrome c5
MRHLPSAVLLLSLLPLLAQTARADAAPDGQAIYDKFCGSCHNPGLGAFFSGAPRLGSDAWKPRLQQAGSVDALVASAARGKGGMPSRGGPSGLNDDQLKAAVVYILGKSGL